MNQEPAEWSRSAFDVVAKCASRAPEVPAWAYPIIGRHALHPTIDKLLSKFAPTDWRQVLQQWPHVSMKDPSRLAYTPSEQYAARDRVLVTSPGKYVAKHWPNIPAHELRDLTLLTTTESSMYSVHTIPEMVIGVEYGPSSCMASTSPWCSHRFKHEEDGFGCLADWVLDKSNPEPNWELHPYASYRPEYGWHMALRKEDGLIVARALCLTFKDKKYFVRSYRNGETEGSSPACETLNAWLMDQGYKFVSDWPFGARIDIGGDENRAPYLDGEYRRAERLSGSVFEINNSGDWVFEDTDGECDYSSTDDEDDALSTCDRCGGRFYSDDMAWVGRNDDAFACDHCLTRHYTLVMASGRNYGYYVNNDDVASVIGSDTMIDVNYPPHDVHWSKEEENYIAESCAVFVDDSWYLDTSDTVVDCKDGEWRIREDCWQDDETGDWYPEDEPYVEQPDGLRYHADTVEALRVAYQIKLL